MVIIIRFNVIEESSVVAAAPWLNFGQNVADLATVLNSEKIIQVILYKR
jgi:hypothetical protein